MDGTVGQIKEISWIVIEIDGNSKYRGEGYDHPYNRQDHTP